MAEVFVLGPGFMLVAGGQTGTDRVELDWAIGQGVPHGGWCPRGRKTEDGLLPDATCCRKPRPRLTCSAPSGTCATATRP